MSPPDKNGAADLEDHVPELRLLPVWAHEGEEIIESKQRDYHSESLCTEIIFWRMIIIREGVL